MNDLFYFMLFWLGYIIGLFLLNCFHFLLHLIYIKAQAFIIIIMDSRIWTEEKRSESVNWKATNNETREWLLIPGYLRHFENWKIFQMLKCKKSIQIVIHISNMAMILFFPDAKNYKEKQLHS